jgi:hypothetical protein
MKSYNALHDEIMTKVKSPELAAALRELHRAHCTELNAAGGGDEARSSRGRAIERLYETSDGQRLVERAFRVDPKKTETELNYLGAYGVAGELKVKLGLEQTAATA